MNTFKIAIASGKGGTGKTFVSCNLFQALQTLHFPVTLVDCDAEEPNVCIFFNAQKDFAEDVNIIIPDINERLCTYCGKCHEYCNYNAIFFIPVTKTIKLIEELCHGCGACMVACKHNAISKKNISIGQITKYTFSQHTQIVEARTRVGVYSPVSVIKKAIKVAGNDSLLIMDAPPGTSCPFIQTVAAADYTVLVSEPTPFGLSDLRQSVETLKIMHKAFGVIINKSGMGNNDVKNYLADEAIPLLLEIPFEKEIAAANAKGKLLVKQDANWQKKFISLYEIIHRNHGNCCS